MKIKPKIINGEPVCSNNCSQLTWDGDHLSWDFWCNVTDRPCTTGNGCIPALKMQRDELLKLISLGSCNLCIDNITCRENAEDCPDDKNCEDCFLDHINKTITGE